MHTSLWWMLACATAVRGVILRSPTGRLVCGSTVVVDDGSRDTTFEGTIQMGNRRTFGSCSFPYNFGLHYTTSNNEAKAVYAPLLPQRGCYLLEEWHPRVDCRVLPGVGGEKEVKPMETSEDLWTGYRTSDTNVELKSYGTCVSSGVRATVRGANNTAQDVYINQQVDGANWNPLLQMMFETSGAEIELTSDGISCNNRACSSSADPNCRRTQQDCHWIADAFRFVYIGSSCPPTPWPTNGQLNGCSTGGLNQGVEVAAMYDRRFSNMPDQESIDSCNPDDGDIWSKDSSSGVPQEVLLWILVAIGSGGIVLFAMYTIYAAATGHFGGGSRSARWASHRDGAMHGHLPASEQYPLQIESRPSKPLKYALVVGPDGQARTIAVELEDDVQEVELVARASNESMRGGDAAQGASDVVIAVDSESNATAARSRSDDGEGNPVDNRMAPSSPRHTEVTTVAPDLEEDFVSYPASPSSSPRTL